MAATFRRIPRGGNWRRRVFEAMTATKKPGSGEDEYIAREEARKAELKRIERDQKEAEAARKARIGTCPRGDATKLVEETFQHLKIDRCPTCGFICLRIKC